MFQNVSANMKTYSGGYMSLSCEITEASIKANKRRDKTRISAKIRIFILLTFFQPTVHKRHIISRHIISRHLPILPHSIPKLTPAYGKTSAKKILHKFFRPHPWNSSSTASLKTFEESYIHRG